ncbi:MAG: isopentenyl-diphosphate Delta-isomerase [Deltaproteobacteria bacterium]|nr:isopentenyl-diphosphate Delta-isomerase [Deltaproteobacteria bacterium]
MKEQVILVDKDDNSIGSEEKMKAHAEGKLHRAFSVFIYNSKGEMLLQQRAFDKYHSGGLWTNACCSHPRLGESIKQAAHRRLKEEMGFDCKLSEKFHFIYKAELDQGLIEHELDHVLIGMFESKINPNPNEAENYQWINIDKIFEDIQTYPGKYSSWFKIALRRLH